MPGTAYGTVRDRQYRVAGFAQDGLRIPDQGLLTSPPPPSGKASLPDDVRNRLIGPRHVALRAQADVWQNLGSTLLYIEPIPYGVQVFPADVRDARAIRQIAQALRAESRANLLSTTLLGQDRVYGDPGQVPVFDYPVPKGRVHPLSLRTLTANGLQDVLLGQDRIYAAPGEAPVYLWPVPPAYPPHRANRTHLQDLLRTTLSGQDLLYGAPGQAPAYAWPNPAALPRRPTRADILNLLDTVLAVAPPADLPDGRGLLPAQRAHLVALRAQVLTQGSLNPTLLAEVVAATPGYWRSLMGIGV